MSKRHLILLLLGIFWVFLFGHSEQVLAQLQTSCPSNGVPVICGGSIVNQDNCFYTNCSPKNPDDVCPDIYYGANGGQLGYDATLLQDCCATYSNWCPSTPSPLPTPTPIPNPPTGTISGPNTLVAGQVGTYTANLSDSDNSLQAVVIEEEGPPAGRQNWTALQGIGCSGSTCTTSVSWQAPAYNPNVSNTYTIMIVGYDYSGLSCSGDPYYSFPSGSNPYRCDPPNNTNAYIIVTVTPPAPTPSSTSTPTPTLTQTPTPTTKVPATCNSTCLGNGDCMSGACYNGQCRNFACLNDPTCSCITPTLSPTPPGPACGSACSTSSDCKLATGCSACSNGACVPPTHHECDPITGSCIVVNAPGHDRCATPGDCTIVPSPETGICSTTQPGICMNSQSGVGTPCSNGDSDCPQPSPSLTPSPTPQTYFACIANGSGGKCALIDGNGTNDPGCNITKPVDKPCPLACNAHCTADLDCQGAIGGCDSCIGGTCQTPPSSLPWFQTDTGDIRFNSFSDSPPAKAFNPNVSTGTLADPSLSSVIFSSNSSVNPPVTTSNNSLNRWLINNEYSVNNLASSQGDTSYLFYLHQANTNNITPKPILQGCSSSCALDQMPQKSGIYIINGAGSGAPINLTSASGAYTVPGNQRIVLLTSVDTDIKTSINVPKGSLFILATQGNLTIDPKVGTVATDDTNTQLDGYYSAEQSIFISGNSSCPTTPDIRLNVGGALIANSVTPLAQTCYNSSGSCSVQNNRSLCAQNNQYPALKVYSRPDFLTQLTNFYKSTTVSWQEVAP